MAVSVYVAIYYTEYGKGSEPVVANPQNINLALFVRPLWFSTPHLLSYIV